MGNVTSFCCKDNASVVDDNEERSRILNDNYGETEEVYDDSQGNSQLDNLSYGSVNNGSGIKTMEQSALDKIYQKMAASVIDIAPGESVVIQQAEFLERQKAYQGKLSQIKTSIPLKSNNRTPKHVNSSFDTTTNGTSSPSSTAANSMLTNTTNNYSSNSLSLGHPAGIGNHSPQHVSKDNEKRRVEYEPISAEDIQLINAISVKSTQAIKSLKINSQEQVVTQFKP